MTLHVLLNRFSYKRFIILAVTIGLIDNRTKSSISASIINSKIWPTIISTNSSQLCFVIWSDDAKFSINNSSSTKLIPKAIVIAQLCVTHLNNPIGCNLFHVKWLSQFQSVCIDSTKIEIHPGDLLRNGNLIDNFIRSNREFRSKLIIFDFYRTPQLHLTYLIEKYPRMRDYHNNPPLYAPMFVGCKIIADTVNATLLAKPDAEKAGLNLEQYPLINPAVQHYDAAGMSVEMFWKKHKFSERTFESAHLVRLIFLGYNFAYCDFPSIKLERPWNLKILVNAFDSYIWFNLLLSITLITVLLHKSAKCWDRQGEISFSLILQSITLALSSIGPSFGGKSPILKKSGLFVLWMLVCIVIANYYSGAITSLLIIPPEEDTMKTFSDLVKRSYSPIFDDFYYIQIVNDTVTKYLADDNGLSVLNDVRNMKALVDQMSISSFIPTRTEYIRLLAYGKKTVIFYMWTYVLSAIDEAKNLIATEELVPYKRRRCYLGKHVVETGQVYFGIAAPGSERLKHVFQVMFQTGLYGYWIREHCLITFAKRVQDRNKFVSPTQIKNDFDSAVSPLQMEGKVLTVFFLWGVCLVGCVLSLGIEICCWRQSNRK
ncbi:unnamed protein product [Orchesella dallaii]|uniref:Uncharacterized protein n=1 Tax=Orchesella dallaii TaxID=48710 RepID=A0ABP1Q6G4_9HEXA